MKTGSTHTPVALPQTPIDVVRTGAGRCVACGMCLPHCPTFNKTKSELESPRGRLSLMLAVANGELAATPKLESHLSLCLLCRACESVCPAGVPFGDVMNATRAQLASGRRPTLATRIGSHAMLLLTQPRWAAFFSRLLRFYQISGLRTLMRLSGVLRLSGLADVEAELPTLARYAPLVAHYPARGKKRGCVSLFSGCIARVTDTETLHSSVRVLTHLGYDVRVPPNQTCCGALHRHGGDAATADTLMQRNIEAFATEDIDTIITTASGCAATLVEYDTPLGTQFAARVMDISAFLAKIDWPSDVMLRPLPKRIAVHDPCTLINVMRSREAPYTLLRKIPRADVISLPGTNQCCGAAGSYHLQHKDMAQSLRDDKIEALRQLAPDILATSNIGCAMHVAAGIRAAGLPVEIVHPVTLLARQLDGHSA